MTKTVCLKYAYQTENTCKTWQKLSVWRTFIRQKPLVKLSLWRTFTKAFFKQTVFVMLYKCFLSGRHRVQSCTTLIILCIYHNCSILSKKKKKKKEMQIWAVCDMRLQYVGRQPTYELKCRKTNLFCEWFIIYNYVIPQTIYHKPFFLHICNCSILSKKKKKKKEMQIWAVCFSDIY
jgi:hypothetical protein